MSHGHVARVLGCLGAEYDGYVQQALVYPTVDDPVCNAALDMMMDLITNGQVSTYQSHDNGYYGSTVKDGNGNVVGVGFDVLAWYGDSFDFLGYLIHEGVHAIDTNNSLDAYYYQNFCRGI